MKNKIVAWQHVISPNLITEILQKMVAVSSTFQGTTITANRVPDTSGKRSAIRVSSSLIQNETPAADWENIDRVIASTRFIDGISDYMLHENPKLFPWQIILPKRCTTILPNNSANLESSPYFYVAKGLRFPDGKIGEFDLIQTDALLHGKPVPKRTRIDPVFSRNGLLHTVPRINEMLGGQDADKALKEYAMMTLAIHRGVRKYADVDSPECFGIFDNVVSLANKPQGFTISRLADKGHRGDDLANIINFQYLTKVLLENPDTKADLLRKLQQGIDQAKEIFLKPDVIADNPHLVNRFISFLNIAETGLFKASQSNDRHTVYQLFEILRLLLSCKVAVPEASYVLNSSKISPELQARWKNDIEAIFCMAGVANRILIEHGIAHEQTYSGNIRYVSQSGQGTSGVICDWHDSHDLLDMPYAQAFGYVAHSLRNVLTNTLKTQSHPILQYIKADILGATLNGYLLNDLPELSHLHFQIPDSLFQQIIKAFTTIPRHFSHLGYRAEIDMTFDLQTKRSGTTINHPFFELVRNTYPLSKHNRLKTLFSNQ